MENRIKEITTGKDKEIEAQQEEKTKDHDSSSASSNNQILSPVRTRLAFKIKEEKLLLICALEHIPGDLTTNMAQI